MTRDKSNGVDAFVGLGELWKDRQKVAEESIHPAPTSQSEAGGAAPSGQPSRPNTDELIAPDEPKVTDAARALAKDHATALWDLAASRDAVARASQQLTEYEEELLELKGKIRAHAKALADSDRQLSIARTKQAAIRTHTARIATLEKDLRSTRRKLSVVAKNATRVQGKLARLSEYDVLVGWLASGLGRNVRVLHPEAVLAGSSPYEKKILTSHLRTRGIEARGRATANSEVMIVGRNDWTEAELESQIYAREGKTLRVYSQELALMSLAVGRDILTDAPRKLLLTIAKDHPALEFLTKSELHWPSCTTPPPLPARFEPSGFDQRGVDESPLKKLGYAVGKTKGVEKRQRQKILRQAIHGTLPRTHSSKYMAEWGQPGTRRRIWRMANHLAWLAQLWSRLPSHDIAVSEWREDLDFMRKEFFRPYMRFAWPETRVPGRRR